MMEILSWEPGVVTVALTEADACIAQATQGGTE